jgi:putative ABC transport system substrate-binding protein
MYADISTKYLEMLLDIVPKLSRVAVLINPGNPAQFNSLKTIQEAAQKIQVTILPVEARTPQEIEAVFAVMAREKAGAVIVLADSLFIQQRRKVAELAAKYRLPSVGSRRAQVEAGFLMSYGPNDADAFRRAATYVDKIFKGAKPADLPVEQPTRFGMFVSRKTAKALGLTIPPALLISAEVIE